MQTLEMLLPSREAPHLRRLEAAWACVSGTVWDLIPTVTGRAHYSWRLFVLSFNGEGRQRFLKSVH